MTQNAGAINDLANDIGNGSTGLVQQDATTRALTVGATTNGARVDFAGTAGPRTLQGIAAGAVSASSQDAINGSQLHGVSQSVSSALGGGATVNPDGSVSAPVYAAGGTAFNNVGDALTNVDGRVTQNSTDISTLADSVNSGTAGLVRQDPGTGAVTVAGLSGGTTVDFTGAAGARTLQGVASGGVAAGSLEAINGGQLFGASQSMSSALGGGSAVNPDGTITAPVYTLGGNTYSNVGDALSFLAAGSGALMYFRANSVLADATASGSNSVAIGPLATSSADNTVAIGTSAASSHANSVALGAGSTTTVGAQASYAGAFVGNSSSSGEVAVGGRQISGLAAGSAATDAVNVSQLQAGVDAAVGQANTYTDTRLGQVGAAVLDVQGLREGSQGMFQVGQGAATVAPTASGANAVAAGSGAVASGQAATAIGANAVASGQNSVAIGASATVSRDNTVSVGTAGAERTVSNVAAGAMDTDAVNLAQLRSVQASGVRYDTQQGSTDPTSLTFNPGGSPTTLHNIGPGVAPNDAVNLSQLQDLVGRVHDDMWQLRREARGGNASAMAMAGVPQAYQPGRSMLGVGVGGFHGEVGMAVGLSGVTDSGRYVYKAQVSSNTTRDF